jgi:hypothetical protein
MRRRTVYLALAMGLGGIVSTMVFTAAADAIPAFARKYGTSCQTCHVAYPKLNSFGEAFRLNGYRYPQEMEDQIKEKPVSLGAEAWKLVWPDGVWPGSIPGTTPLSLRTQLRARYAAMEEDGEREFIKGDLEFPPEVEVLAAGTMGDDMAFFLGLEVEQEIEDGSIHAGVAVHRAELRWNDLLGKGNALNLKVGFLEPELVTGFSHHRRLTFADYDPLFSYDPLGHDGGEGVAGGHGHGGARGRAIPNQVQGAEVYGILSSRFLYSVGVANGIGPGSETFDGNQSKDFFGRVAYKFGGMGLDGTLPGGADAEPVETENWIDNSLRVGLFGYFGNGSGIQYNLAHDPLDPPELFEDRNFSRLGLDASLFAGNLNVFGAFVTGSDELREDGDPATDETFDYSAFAVEANYIIKPWIIGVLRYESLSPADGAAENFERLIPNLTFLLRANVKVRIELQQNMAETDFYTILGGIDFAF